MLQQKTKRFLYQNSLKDFYSFTVQYSEVKYLSQKQLSQVFLRISQNSQVNTCVRVSFIIKLQASVSEVTYQFSETLRRTGKANTDSYFTMKIYRASLFLNLNLRVDLYHRIRVKLVRYTIITHHIGFINYNFFHNQDCCKQC